MVRNLIKSLFLFSTLAASVVLGAPAHKIADRAADEPVSIHAFQPSGKGTTAVERGVTNAMRLANGLPPLSPRRLYEGSKAGSAHKARTSSIPAAWTGILVYDANGLSGTRLGYLSKNLNAYQYYALTTSCSAAMTSPQLSSGALLNPASPGYNRYPNVGFGSSAATFSSADGTSANMYPLPETVAGSGPVKQTNQAWAETNVWSLGDDNELIGTWVNPDGSTVKMNFLSQIAFYNTIVMTGNVSKYQSLSSYTRTAVPIRFFLTDQPLCTPVQPLP